MEESGWKNVHGDIFRPPQYPMILSSLLGSGIQLFCMVLIVICTFFHSRPAETLVSWLTCSARFHGPALMCVCPCPSPSPSPTLCGSVVAMLGMLSPSSRGALMTTACFLFMFMG